MTALHFLIDTVCSLYISVILIRLWLHWVRADFYNPFSQFIAKATSPLLAPLQKVVPAIGRFDTATFLLAYLISCGKFSLLVFMSAGQIPYVDVAVIAGLQVIKQFGFLLFWCLLARALLSWFSQGRSPFESVLEQLTEPMLSPIRRVIPPMGGLDLSILVLFIGLQALNFLMGDLMPGIWPRL